MTARRMLAWTLIVLWSPAAWAEIYGFAINKIEGLNGVELDDRFGTSASSTEHLVNYKDCLSYLGLEPGQTTADGATAEVVEPATVETPEIVEVVDTATPDAALDTVSDTTADGSGGGGGSTSEGIRKVSFDWQVNDSALTGKWWYSIRIGSCTESSEVDEAATETCTYLRQKTELIPYASDTIEVTVSRLLGTECVKGSTEDVRLYFTIQSDVDYNDRATETLDIQLDYDPPKQVSNVVLEAGEQNLSLSWDDEANTETVTYKVYWYDASFDENSLDAVSSKGDLTAKSYQITDLENGKKYFVAVAALDEFDNESALTDLVDGTPVVVTDGFEAYKNAGGVEKGGFGCSMGERSAASAAVLLLLLIALVAALPVARRRRAGRDA